MEPIPERYETRGLCSRCSSYSGQTMANGGTQKSWPDWKKVKSNFLSSCPTTLDPTLSASCVAVAGRGRWITQGCPQSTHFPGR